MLSDTNHKNENSSMYIYSPHTMNSHSTLSTPRNYNISENKLYAIVWEYIEVCSECVCDICVYVVNVCDHVM